MMTSSSFSKFQMKLMNAGKKLLLLSSSSSSSGVEVLEILTVKQMDEMLSEVQQSPSGSMIKVLHHINESLFAKELLKHRDMNVNIAVACCICEVMRIMAPDSLCNDDQMKDFFEVIVMTFEKLSSESGGCYTKMTKVLKIFCNIRLAVLMLDVQVEGLVGRLFKQFLTSADSNSSVIVLKMEKIMTMIIEESEDRAPELQGLIVASLKKDKQIASPVCWQLGEKVLMNWFAKLKPGLLNMGRDMSIALYDYSKMISLMRKTASESHIMDPKALGERNPTTTNKIKLESLEEMGNMVQTIRHCQHGSSDTVNTQGIHSEIGPKHEKTTISVSGDPPMPSKSVKQVNGKRKRYKTPWKKWAKSAEHGENLVGSRVRVWWPADKDYYEGVVDSFDRSKKKHKILYDDGDEDLLDLRLRKWLLYQDASDTPEPARQEVPQKVSSPQPSVICVHGYNVKESVAPILESIIKKQGDIAANCIFKTDSIRASFLEAVCEVFKQIQTNELIVTMEEIECKVSDAEAANIDVSWLRAHLEDMKKSPFC